MFRNYLKIAFRNLVRDKFYSSLNIIGLSVGIASALLIILYIVDELSYDQFLKDKDRIYRVATMGKFGDQNVMNLAVSSAPLAEGFRNSIPEIETTTRLSSTVLIINHEDEVVKEEHVFFADSTFFDIFSFKFLQGNPKKALTEPNSIVLNRSTAIKYFGEVQVSEGKVVGQMLKSGDKNYKITGIMEDVPYNSHMSFDILISMSSNPEALNPIWISMNFFTYLKLKQGADINALPEKFRDIIMKYVLPQVIAYLHFPESQFSRETMDEQFKYYLQPVTDIHLRSNLYAEMQPNGNIQYIYIFGTIAIFIVLIACINFMNLATARSARRAREVGIRKTMGSASGKLAGQFMLESLIFILIAVILALGLTEAFRIPFNTIAGKNLSFNIFLHPWILLLILGITVFVSLIAGSYPAFYLTRFRPVEVLKGAMMNGKNKSIFRSILVILQFVISIGLIVCTLLVYKQMNYIRNKNLGFQKENVIVLKNGWDMGPAALPYKQELLNMNEVISASFSTHVPSQVYWSSTYQAEGESQSDHIVYYCRSDYNYAETMDLKILRGRYYSKDYPSDSSALVINETAAKIFGWGGNQCEDAIGKYVETMGQFGKRDKLQVIGVVMDYNFQSLHDDIRAMAIQLSESGPDLVIKIKPGNHPETVDKIRNLWKSKVPWVPFEYSFLDDDYDKLFEKENTLGTIFIVFATLSIFIACLGLFGLAAYTAQQRTKEIGIRKVMGANAGDVVNMLNREFTKLVIIAFIIAVPLAWYLMYVWFKNFAFKTSIGIWPFAAAGITALLIAWITVSYQSIRAAVANPVDSLRNE